MQNDEATVRGTLPAAIAGFFSLEVRFSNNGRRESIVISDPSLTDTDTINVVIPREKLPSFNSFRASVAIRSNNRVGPFTEQSNVLGKSAHWGLQIRLEVVIVFCLL